jgi:hypothetical protein
MAGSTPTSMNSATPMAKAATANALPQESIDCARASSICAPRPFYSFDGP